jgi:integrase
VCNKWTFLPLKPDEVAAAIRGGVNQKISDGNNLYLVVRNGHGFWVLQYRDGRGIRSKGLGSAAKVTPAQARRAREEFVVGRRKRNGTAPGLAVPRLHVLAAPSDLTFGETVEELIVHRARVKSWKGGANGAEAKSYRRTLINTTLDRVPIASVATADVLAALCSMPAVTAEKTRTRIACVLDWAKAIGYRPSGENIARRRGHMEFLLSAVPDAKHHAALAWPEVPELMRELQIDDSSPARALQWTILTAARTAETLGATRLEIKSPKEYAHIAKLPTRLIGGDTWIVPADRMKEGREHHVPLTKEVLELIEHCKGNKLFPGYGGQMMELLGKLRPGYTVHGFRSSFTDWAAENDYPQELREMALAHAVGDSVEQAYRHTTRLSKRREMMSAWTNFVLGKPASN